MNTFQDQKSYFDALHSGLCLACDALVSPLCREDLSAAELDREFLIHAERFAAECSTACAVSLRQTTLLLEVRGTPTRQLAAEIRQDTFKELDTLLVGAMKELATFRNNLVDTISELQRSDTLGAMMDGAVAGGVIGKVIANKPVGGALIGAMNAHYGQIRDDLDLATRAYQLAIIAEMSANRKVLDYFEKARTLPEALIDFIGAKCFGGAVDFTAQSECISRTLAYFEKRFQSALVAREETWEREEERKNRAEQAEQARARRLAKSQVKKLDNRMKIIHWIFGCALLITLLLIAITPDRSDSDKRDGILGILTFFLPFWAFIAYGMRKGWVE